MPSAGGGEGDGLFIVALFHVFLGGKDVAELEWPQLTILCVHELEFYSIMEKGY